ncbi:TetR/AcrR family transcriptional regulator [Lactiplantibacillus herbarum]|uniref:TetR/AcrR family transcriptional regulator n=1 Tax=Lactiplantibacillus herbarum TaxID=1670446 RepID=UPI00069DB339|nr:TetR/AcrR family transcriptional regulator [Lactiplantibacillus herbarum]
MKSHRSDLRTQKTYTALFTAFNQLIQQKNFSEITVTELCRVAQTRTATFYNHFDDKYDFFAFMIKALQQEQLEQAEFTSTATDSMTYLNELLALGFDLIESHLAMIEHIQADSLLVTIIQTNSEYLAAQIQKHLPVNKDPQVDEKLQTQIIVGALFQASRWWLSHRSTVSKEQIQTQLSLVLQRLYQFD